MNKKLLPDLYEILKEELACLHSFKDQAFTKKEVIIENNIEQLSNISKKENQIIEKMKKLEEKRLKIIKKLSLIYQLNSEELIFADLVKKLPLLWQEKMSLIIEEIKNLNRELKRINKTNKVLLAEAIKLNNFSMNMLMKISKIKNQTYNHHQTLCEKDLNHIIDRQG